MLTSDYKILPGGAHVGIQTTRSYLEVHILVFRLEDLT
jgi:hypothetical protein